VCVEQAEIACKSACTYDVWFVNRVSTI
jgi:hypothetical protein